MELMTDNAARLPSVEVMLSGAVTVETLGPILRCLRQLLAGGAQGSYVIRAEEVTRIDLEAAELMVAFVTEVVGKGAKVRWAAASRSLIATAQALAIDRRIGLAAAS